MQRDTILATSIPQCPPSLNRKIKLLIRFDVHLFLDTCRIIIMHIVASTPVNLTTSGESCIIRIKLCFHSTIIRENQYILIHTQSFRRFRPPDPTNRPSGIHQPNAYFKLCIERLMRNDIPVIILTKSRKVAKAIR